MKYFLLFALSLLDSNPALAGFMPDNWVDHTMALASFLPKDGIEYKKLTTPTMTEREFNEQIEKANAFYKPLIKENHGVDLIFKKYWKSATVNASASLQGKNLYISMYGGLARRVTPDGFLAVIGHELSHFLGSYPFYGTTGWAASVEGESDYIAILSVLRNLLADETVENAAFAKVVPAYPKAKCEAAWSSLDDKNLCFRLMMASKSIGDLLSNNTARFETPSKKVVQKTYNGHPAGQARLDSMVQAAICKATFTLDTIPGADLGRNRNSVQAEQEQFPFVCNGDEVGARPKSWFKSQL